MLATSTRGRSPVSPSLSFSHSRSSVNARLLLFVSIAISLPLLLLATPTPDQYGTPEHHHAHEPSQVHSIKLQNSGYHHSGSLLPLQVSVGNDKLSSDHNKKDGEPSRNVRSVDASEIHRVKVAKNDYQTGSLLPLQLSTPSSDKDATQKENNHKKNDVPLSDLQTGCADGSVDVKIDAISKENTQKETIHYEGDDDLTIDQVKSLDESLQNTEEGDYNGPLEELDINVEDNNVPLLYSNIHRAKRDTDETTRQKRDFIRWYGTSTYQSQPSQQTYISSYQLSARVPYFVPIWGNPGRIPVFFPLRPILYNPGYPVANPPNPQPPYPNPTYDNTDNQNTGNVSIGNRINVEHEGNPVWGIVEPETSIANSDTVNSGSGSGSRPNTDIRKPKIPPLLHKPSRTDADDNTVQPNPPFIPTVQNELIPTRPPPVAFNPSTRPPQIPENNRDPLFDFANTPRPIFVPTTRRPQNSGNFPPANQGRQEPSRCVWAVISCCSPLSNNVRYSCFEQLGCNGSFWDGNPCSREYTTAALNAAQRFYDQMETRR